MHSLNFRAEMKVATVAKGLKKSFKKKKKKKELSIKKIEKLKIFHERNSPCTRVRGSSKHGYRPHVFNGSAQWPGKATLRQLLEQ